MWTSAGSAAQTLNTFGAVTLAVSPTEDQSVSLDNVSFAESHQSFDNTPSRRSQHNGIWAPPPSPEIELSVRISSPPKRGSLPLIRHMPATPETYQNVNDDDAVPRLNVTRLAPLEKGTNCDDYIASVCYAIAILLLISIRTSNRCQNGCANVSIL